MPSFGGSSWMSLRLSEQQRHAAADRLRDNETHEEDGENTMIAKRTRVQIAMANIDNEDRTMSEDVSADMIETVANELDKLPVEPNVPEKMNEQFNNQLKILSTNADSFKRKIKHYQKLLEETNAGILALTAAQESLSKYESAKKIPVAARPRSSKEEQGD